MGKNYFEFFEIPYNYTVDKKQLDSLYIELQKKYHPDNFPGIDQEKKLKLTSFSETINHAYETLKNDIRRGEYILNLNKFTIFGKENMQKIVLNAQEMNSVFDIQAKLEQGFEIIENIRNVLSKNIQQKFDNNDFIGMSKELLFLSFCKNF